MIERETNDRTVCLVSLEATKSPWTNYCMRTVKAQVHTSLVYEGKLGHVIQKNGGLFAKSFPLKYSFATFATLCSGFREVRAIALALVGSIMMAPLCCRPTIMELDVDFQVVISFVPVATYRALERLLCRVC